MSKISRREAYRMYRSLGYSAKEARNMRNRSTPRLISDYRAGMETYNEKRKELYQSDDKPPYVKKDRPHRPEIPYTEKESQHYQNTFSEYGIPDHYQEWIFENGTAFDLDIYESRFAGFKNHFESNGIDWDELIEQLGEIEDFGDFLDALGELYDED